MVTLRDIRFARHLLGIDAPDFRKLLAELGITSSAKCSTSDSKPALLDQGILISKMADNDAKLRLEHHAKTSPDIGEHNAATPEQCARRRVLDLWRAAWNLGLTRHASKSGLLHWMRRQYFWQGEEMPHDVETLTRVQKGLKRWLASEALVQWQLPFFSQAIVMAQLRRLRAYSWGGGSELEASDLFRAVVKDCCVTTDLAELKSRDWQKIAEKLGKKLRSMIYSSVSLSDVAISPQHLNKKELPKSSSLDERKSSHRLSADLVQLRG